MLQRFVSFVLLGWMRGFLGLESTSEFGREGLTGLGHRTMKGSLLGQLCLTQEG